MCIRVSQTQSALQVFSRKSDIRFLRDYDFSKMPTDIRAGIKRFFIATAVKDEHGILDEYIVRSNWGFTLNDMFLFNARFETLKVKSTWRQSADHQRVLIPVDGFYEHGYYIHPEEGYSGMALAGITVKLPDGHHSSVVLTRNSTPEFAKIHNRMPVSIPPSEWHKWLDPDVPFEEFRRLAKTSTHHWIYDVATVS